MKRQLKTILYWSCVTAIGLIAAAITFSWVKLMGAPVFIRHIITSDLRNIGSSEVKAIPGYLIVSMCAFTIAGLIATRHIDYMNRKEKEAKA